MRTGERELLLSPSSRQGPHNRDKAVCSCITAENRQDTAEGVEETPVRRIITDLT